MSDDPMFSAALNYILERIEKAHLGAGSVSTCRLSTQCRGGMATDDRFRENGMLRGSSFCV